jgi:polyisoprenoid-binding protein YceI
MLRSLFVAALTLLVVAPVTAQAADTYEVDPVHSGINFRVQHLGVAYTWGRFNEFSGSVVIDEANPAKSSVELVIDTSSVDTNSAKRDEHLRNPDFFDTKTFPKATFKSSSVSVKGDEYTVEGTLDLHGVEKPVTLVLTRVGSGEFPRFGYRTGFSGTYSFKRSDYGISYGVDGPVGDEVELFIDVELVRQ